MGDIESQPFLEAIRQVSLEIGQEHCLFIHVTLVPFLKWAGEHKSKPTQHSVKELRSMGISPRIIVARTDEPLDEQIKAKIALFCNVQPDCVVENRTLSCLYEAPLMLHQNGLDTVVCRELGLRQSSPICGSGSRWWREFEAIKRSCHRHRGQICSCPMPICPSLKASIMQDSMLGLMCA